MNTTISQTHDITSRLSRPTEPCVCGTYAEVNRCNLKEDGKKHKSVAVKSYKSKFNDPLEKNSKTIRSDIQLLLSLPHHVNVVPFLGFKKDGASLSLVMPWMSAGTLTSFIRTVSIETAAKTMLSHDISSGLEHLHSNFVIHGNLESDNVLITERHSACLSGFRQSVRLSSRDAAGPQFQMPPKPAIQFAGPEWFVRDDARFQHLPLPKRLFKSDIYSLGCLMFYIFTKSMPWHDATSVDISDQLRTCVTPSRPRGTILNDDQWALIEPCLSLLPQDRPSTSEVLVLIGPPDLTGQIKRQRNYPNASGGYGSVYESIWSRKTGGQVKVAVKVMHVQDSSRIDEVKKVVMKVHWQIFMR
ncbi:kinase-like domain-containing protein [Suillus placidus]|uniref:Kinase-like domain-containing protein n=1 Tax=Suillus placidus TaxID=48579 RepID=A0A9P6ZX70_9AGAM|nr:kinase-like domain-containing protein [Suillus placidus]